MKVGPVERYFWERIEEDGAMLLVLIDPDKQYGERAARLARSAYEAGADVILIGGSIGAQGEFLDTTVKMIKEAVGIPVVLFPGNISGITKYADAIWFMRMINSRDVYWNSTAQIQAAPVVKRMGLEAIPAGYVVLEPGKAVGWIGNANLVPRDRGDLAAACALSGELLGNRIIITDSGSGAETPAPTALVRAVASAITVPYVYGGGVRQPDQAREIILAGADAVQIGTAFEMRGDGEHVRRMVDAVKEAGKKKKKSGRMPELPF